MKYSSQFRSNSNNFDFSYQGKVYTIDPWTTRVWTAWIHLYADKWQALCLAGAASTTKHRLKYNVCRMGNPYVQGGCLYLQVPKDRLWDLSMCRFSYLYVFPNCISKLLRDKSLIYFIFKYSKSFTQKTYLTTVSLFWPA